MKSNRKNLLLTSSAVITLTLTAPAAFAASLYWDSNGDTAGAGTAPTGIWGTDPFWNTTADGDVTAPTNATTTAVDDLFFSAGTDAIDPYTVTVDATRDAKLITIEEGTPTFAGGTLINLGTDGGITVAAGAGDPVFTTPVTLGGNNTITVGAGRNLALNGNVTGALVKAGDGTATLGNTTTHALTPWTVNGGTLVLHTGGAEVIPGGTVNNGGTAKLAAGNRVANGAVFTVNAGGIFDINNQGDLIGGIAGAGSFTNSGAGAPTFSLGSAGNQTFSGVISGGFALVKRGGGDQILSGENTHTGTTAITNPGTNATLTLANPLALQNSALETSTSVAGNGTIGLRTTVTTLTLGGLVGNTTAGKNLASLFRTDASGGPSGTTALGGYSGVTALTLNPPASVTRTYVAVIADGAPGMTLTKTGAGIQVLSGNNTYTGSTTVSVGTLRLGNATDTLADSGSVNVNGGILDIAGNSDTVGAVTLTSGSITGTTGTLTGSSYAVESGSISAKLGGTGIALTKSTGGTATLTGNNTYTGSTTISEGTLQLSGTGRLNGGTYAGNMSIGSGAAFEIIAGASQTLTGPISGNGTLSHIGNGQTFLQTATNSFGALTVGTSTGRVFISTFASLPSTATVSVTTGNLVFSAGTQTYNNAITVGDGGTLTARAASVLSNVTLPGSGTVIFQNDDAATNPLSIGGDQTLTGPLTVQIGGARTNNGALGAVTVSGKLTGSGPLVVTNSAGNLSGSAFGTGSLILSNPANDYTGDTTVNRGTLSVTGSLGATAVTVNSPATLSGNGNLGGNVTIESGATHSLAVAATPGAQVTRAITGTLTLNSGNLLKLTAATTPAGGEYVLATATAITGSIDNANINYGGINGLVSVDTASDPKRLLLTVTSSGFSAWITGTFANGTVPSGQQGPNADPDNDGISNLVEYAILDQDPTVPNATVGSFNGTLLSFSKRLDATGLTYAIQDSTDLGLADAWAPVGSYTENSASTISYTLTPGTPPKNFLRLQVLDN